MGKVAEAFAIDAAGNPVALQEHQVDAAHEAGFTPVSGKYAAELQGAQENKDYVDENWGTAGKAAMGLGSGLTLGLGPAALARMGLLDRGHLEAAEGSGAYQVGDVAGMLLPAFLSGGESVAARGGIAGALEGGGAISKALRFATPAGLMGEAGGAAERLAARFLPEAGLMGKLGAPTLKMAARGATEGAIVNLSHTVADNVIQNKPLAAQSLLAAGVDGALFGGLTGGILGGVSAAAGAGIDLVGGRVATSGMGRGVEGKAGTALKRLGASEGKLAELAEREGDLVTPLKGYYKVLQDGGESLASDTGAIHSAVKGMEKKYGAIAADAVKTLQRESPSVLDGRLAMMTDRIKTDLVSAFQGTAAQGEVGKLYSALKKDLSGMKTWEHWTKSREQLADKMHASKGIQQDVYKTALNAFDGELEAAMTRANPELATTFKAATTGQRQAREMLEMTSGKAAQEAGQQSALHMNGADAATFGYSVLAGANPLVGAGIIAGKKIVQHVQQKMGPAMAEAAYRSAIGANAAHATVAIGARINSSLERFMTGGRMAAERQYSKETKPRSSFYTPDNYQKMMDLSDDLTSASHQAKVREMTDALTTAGHADLANEMMMTYGRAVSYINQNKPKGSSKEHKAGSLGKMPKAMGLTTQGMRFLTQLDGIRNPMGIMDKLDAGDVPARAAVAAIKYVYPDFHQDVVERATNQIIAMKEQGKFLPADKIATLGVVLDAVVDSKLTKEYIAEVQQGLAANKKPAGAPGDAPPPNTDTTQYQTPLQSSIG